MVPLPSWSRKGFSKGVSILPGGEAGGASIKAGNGDLDDAANSLHKYLFNYSIPQRRKAPSMSSGPAARRTAKPSSAKDWT